MGFTGVYAEVREGRSCKATSVFHVAYVVRVTDLRPHTVAEAEQRLADACEPAIADGRLLGSFHTEIGPLNRLVQIWAGDGAREELEAIGDLVVADCSLTIEPFAVSPPIAPAAVGPFFELRTYRYPDGELPTIVSSWELALPGRLALGPLVLVGSEEREGVNTLLHLWPYRSLDDRERIRRTVREQRVWPPRDVARDQGLPVFELLQMENAILVPASFSPLR